MAECLGWRHALVGVELEAAGNKVYVQIVRVLENLREGLGADKATPAGAQRGAGIAADVCELAKRRDGPYRRTSSVAWTWPAG